ncbi:hypothetical protein GALMADRAFT_813202 [Galerina marginata CBS 339.88]|uniref:Heterokaryon incompatibility domain-containing protein n=1 Tax=Galerina marginata (strain CBS 339.88) TaxID=685588 RepID=A0A067ST99_GALM3|nr:hypothetical protein GALMADRAFT_813202 [Galerina marginata CBS 339.88]
MQLIGMEPIRRRVEPAMDEWILDHFDEFENRRNPEAFLKDFLRESTKFAILSHRWSNDEMTFQDLLKLSRITGQGINSYTQQQKLDKIQLTSAEVIDKLVELSGGQTRSLQEPPLLSQLTAFLPHIPHCTGLVKLVNFCALALNSHHCNLAWIDTCCIDKTSSAELDEAIRSMFRWYRGSAICIIHLADTETKDWPGSTETPDLWFSRGWTLQELLAPPIVKFYSSRWKEFTTASNDKSDEPFTSVIRSPRQDTEYYDHYKDKSMVDWLSEVTKVPAKDLLHFRPGLSNLRQRLAWSSSRLTTRVEDMAYCLLGIFNVNLSIAYGEGDMSYYRFQRAIMEQSNDRGLFQWYGHPSTLSSMLAKEPKCFSSDRQPIDTDAVTSLVDPTFMLTNHGLRLSVSLFSKEFSINWLNKVMAANSYSRSIWDKLGEADKTIHEAFRLAILGYSKGMPVTFMLIQQQIRGHICYTRFPGDSENLVGKPADEWASEVGKPEIIYIR